MEENERKYEILPGVKLPDMKELRAASSDFSDTGVSDVDIAALEKVTEATQVPERASLEDIKKLQELGDEVAETEARQAEESRKKMEAIMKSAVTQSASIEDLKKSAASQASEEKLAEIEKRQQEEAERLAQEEEKQRVREERRAMQRKQLEDAMAKKNESSVEEAKPEETPAEESVVVEEAKEEPKETEAVAEAPVAEAPAEEPAPAPAPAPEPVEEDIAEPEEPAVDIDATGVIASDEQAFEDFGEFLDDGNKS